ncbi:oxidoreductase [Ktedonosporobacter rubrisoli]|uniref:Oxidoreductase n=1 Tax=Ktedonosporobacter rubrisoli TaxID=2509675 RepID=A0A4P6JLI3_KTERU|nr:aldo/keto reductase [Ktedonosporobacter rubrisoli]QBD76107.1 oxidoreductase [Ktedonosporobacter rubrisoli]
MDKTSTFFGKDTPLASAAGTITLGGELVVTRLGFGTMQLPGAGAWGEPADPARARAVLRRAVELGINFIDTSDYYGPHVANRLIVEALYPYPQDLVFATKIGFKRGADGSFIPDPRPESLRLACEENLSHLKVERLDLVHFRYGGSPEVPFMESVGTLQDLQREGKIRHIGLSNVTLAQLQEARATVPIATVENLYNLADRSSEQVVDWCTQQRIAFLPFLPLGKGKLVQADGPLASLAKRYQVTPAHLALAWLLARSPMILPIPGTSSVQHIEENVAAASLRLSEEDLSTLAAQVASVQN